MTVRRKVSMLFVVLLACCLVLCSCATRKVRSDGEIRNVYLAGPFFNDAEIEVIEYVESVLAAKGLSYYSPMRHGVFPEVGTPEWAEALFESDRAAIEEADAVVAVYYGSNSDTGTAWDCGYAASLGIPVILVHVYEDGDSNLKMHVSATTNIYMKDLEKFDFNELPVYEYQGTVI